MGGMPSCAVSDSTIWFPVNPQWASGCGRSPNFGLAIPGAIEGRSIGYNHTFSLFDS
jgi:hypothetical protein